MPDGRLQAIFTRWGMWNEDQPRLYARVLAADIRAAAPDLRAEAGAGPLVEERRPLESAGAATLRYLPALFRAALITLALSCLSMLLAVSSGMIIATGRVYGAGPLRVALT